MKRFGGIAVAARVGSEGGGKDAVCRQGGVEEQSEAQTGRWRRKSTPVDARPIGAMGDAAVLVVASSGRNWTDSVRRQRDFGSEGWGRRRLGDGRWVGVSGQLPSCHIYAAGCALFFGLPKNVFDHVEVFGKLLERFFGLQNLKKVVLPCNRATVEDALRSKKKDI